MRVSHRKASHKKNFENRTSELSILYLVIIIQTPSINNYLVEIQEHSSKH